jgi:hypothetical protein
VTQVSSACTASADCGGYLSCANACPQ